jgi:4-alpha-glucanotransferase
LGLKGFAATDRDMTQRLRESGILLHVTSLPSEQGIGNFGPTAYRFVDFLSRTRQQLWQVLPIGPTGYGNSPYQSYSAFAGNPLLISLEALAAEGLLETADLPGPGAFPDDAVAFDDVALQQARLLGQALERFRSKEFADQHVALTHFAVEHAAWLDDYALFQALKWAHGGVAWTSWEPKARDRDPAALASYREQLRQQIELEKFAQFKFYSQWRALKRYANERGISIIGDLPIFVAHDSADVWVNKDQFYLDPDGRPQVVAGVPPDYFSATGQLWGNPIYRWDKMAAEGFAWWIERIRGALELFDRIRIDHFRGFESYWEVPGDATVASGGHWVPGPGAALFEAAQRELGPLPIIAEDLGVITPQVDALRDQLGFPGMRVLQFAFGDDPKASDYQPLNYPRECLVYTGTHDNDTTVGWFSSQAGEGTTREQESIDRERRHALHYLGTDGREVHWDMIRLALASVANTAVFPMQDLLGLGSEARMNLPGTPSGNWTWRFTWEMLTPEIEQRLREMTETYERATGARHHG